MSDICSVPGCGKCTCGAMYCGGHNAQYRKYGYIKYTKLRQNTGRTSHPLYNTWLSMRDRCNNPNNRYYKNYGGRGIKICDRWLDHADGFENFAADMGPRPDGCSLDRINNDGDYSPDNCRWSDKISQNLNKRTNLISPYISTRERGEKVQYVVRVKDLRDKTGKTVRTKVRLTLEDAIAARDILLKEMEKSGQRNCAGRHYE